MAMVKAIIKIIIMMIEDIKKMLNMEAMAPKMRTMNMISIMKKMMMKHAIKAKYTLVISEANRHDYN